MITLALLLATAGPQCEAPLPAATERLEALSAQMAGEKQVPAHLRLRIDDALRRLGKVIERRRARCRALDDAACAITTSRTGSRCPPTRSPPMPT